MTFKQKNVSTIRQHKCQISKELLINMDLKHIERSGKYTYGCVRVKYLPGKKTAKAKIIEYGQNMNFLQLQ